MFGSETLDIAIGIIFIFLLVSIICSAIREGIEAWLKTRAAYLEYGIRELLHDKTGVGLAKSFYEHPLIHSLFLSDYNPKYFAKSLGLLANGANLPSYIPSKNFAQALIDIAVRGPATDIVSSDPNSPVVSLENIRINILNIENQAVQRVLLTSIDSAQGDLNQAQANIEAWFNSSMDRVSGWYKRSTAWILFWIGLFIAIVMNINIITIAEYLEKNDSARAAIVARAQEAAKDTTFLSRNYQKARDDIDALKLPIGWENIEFGLPWNEHQVVRTTKEGNQTVSVKRGWWKSVFSPLLGWLLTAIAAAMGAPFWFDILNKVMVIRSTVKPHEKSPEEDSEDRQFPKVNPVKDEGNNQDPSLINPSNAKSINSNPAARNQKMLIVPAPLDDESDIDGCEIHDHNNDETTKDEALPIAQGGVA